MILISQLEYYIITIEISWYQLLDIWSRKYREGLIAREPSQAGWLGGADMSGLRGRVTTDPWLPPGCSYSCSSWSWYIRVLHDVDDANVIEYDDLGHLVFLKLKQCVCRLIPKQYFFQFQFWWYCWCSIAHDAEYLCCHLVPWVETHTN